MAQPQFHSPVRPGLPSLESSDEDWPYDALQDFMLRMAGHGLPVSTRMMAGNRLYAVEQLARAHALGDHDLSELALALFRHFERQRSGIRYAA